MLTIGDRIKIKRQELGLTQDELAEKTGYKSRSSINKIERGGNDLPLPKIIQFAKVLCTTPSYLLGWNYDNLKSLAESLCRQNGISMRKLYEDINTFDLEKPDSIKKIADYFYVSEEFLSSGYNKDLYCSECGYKYNDENLHYTLSHDDFHSQWQYCLFSYGFCWNKPYRDEVMRNVYPMLDNQSTLLQDKIKLYTLIFKALFSESLENVCFSTYHIKFVEYCGALLTQEPFRYSISRDVLDRLTQIFPPNDIVLNGTLYLIPDNVEEKVDDELCSERLPYKELKMLHKYRALDAHSKKIVDFVIDEEYERFIESADKSEPPHTIRIKHSTYKASAGFGFDLEDRDEWDEIDIPDTPEARDADFAVTIFGNSMEPIYHDNDIVLVKIQDRVNIGETGIFVVNGQGYIKQYGGDRLISVNSEYDDIVFTEGDYIKCAGKVIGIA